MRKKKGLLGSSSVSSDDDIESVDIYFSDDDECGETTVLGKPVATFSFGTASQVNEVPILTQSPATSSAPDVLQKDNKSYTRFNPKGTTPAIDGESFSLKRGYQLRPSTLRKLNELKARHPDVNAYLNTILDAAILHYYDYIVNKNGQFPS